MRSLFHPRIFSRLQPVFNRVATIEFEDPSDNRNPIGEPVLSWATLPGHDRLHVAISALNTFQRDSYAGASVRIMLPGYHPDVTTAHRVRTVDDDAIYRIMAVDHAFGQITRLMCESSHGGATQA